MNETKIEAVKKRFVPFLILVPLLVMLFGFSDQKAIKSGKNDWTLAYQSYTFRKFTFEEGLQKASSLGLKYVEAYSGQPISSGNSNPTHFTSDDASRTEMKSLLKKYGIKLVNYGVIKAKDEQEWKKVFDFAKEMGIQTITAEPGRDQFDFLEKMCNDYKINIAIHNHPRPSGYWAPDSVLKYIEGRGKRIGACADVGHWVRSGLDPVECLKKLKGHIISLHFKDLNEKARQAHDVPWGTGVSNVPAMLQELKDQKFKGVFSIEYEHNWDNSVPEIGQCIENFKRIQSTLK